MGTIFLQFINQSINNPENTHQLQLYLCDFTFVSLSSVSEDEQHVSRRYVESTIASEISKIMESMMQRNFVEFLLNQREKKSMWVTEWFQQISSQRRNNCFMLIITALPHRPAATAEEDQELYNNLLKLSVHEKQKRKI